MFLLFLFCHCRQLSNTTDTTARTANMMMMVNAIIVSCLLVMVSLFVGRLWQICLARHQVSVLVLLVVPVVEVCTT